MYQVTIKGRNLEELKKAVADIHNELTGGTILNSDANIQIHKDMGKPVVETVATDSEVIPPVETPAPVTPTNTVIDLAAELDNEGLPWDKRINSSGKTKNVKGFWNKKRKIDPEYIVTIKGEIRNAMQFAANPPAVPALPGVVTPVPVLPTNIQATEVLPIIAENPALAQPVQPLEVVTPVLAPVQPPLAVVAPAQPVVAPTPPVMSSANGHTLDTFKTNFPMILASLITEKKITQEYVEQLKAYFNVTQIWDVSDAQKGEMFENFASCGFITKV